MNLAAFIDHSSSSENFRNTALSYTLRIRRYSGLLPVYPAEPGLVILVLTIETKNFTNNLTVFT